MSPLGGLCATLALAFASVAASGQVSPDVQQISDAPASVVAEPVQQPPRGEATAQLSDRGDSGTTETQLSSVQSSHGQPTQLSTGPRSAQPPQALSRPAEGRTGAIDPVEGNDRCDARLPRDKKGGDCSQVIETRAADYSRPPPTQLSPEQRLLIDQRLQSVDNDLSDVTRRLAQSGDGDASMESQAVASIVLNQGEPDTKPVKQEKDPAADAAAQAVLQILSITPPQN